MPIKSFIFRTAGVGLIALWSASGPGVWAQEASKWLGVDPNVSVENLLTANAAESSVLPAGSLHLRTSRRGNFFTSDASMVLSNVDFGGLLRDSRAFSDYVAMRMPNLLASEVVIPGVDDFVVWTHMRTRVLFHTEVTRHFIRVRLMPGPNHQGGEGQTWELYHPSSSERRQFGFSEDDKPDDSSFHAFSGAWYMQPLGDGRVYCRYVISGVVKSSLVSRGGLGSSIAMRQFSSGVAQVMGRLYARASERTRREAQRR